MIEMIKNAKDRGSIRLLSPVAIIIYRQIQSKKDVSDYAKSNNVTFTLYI